MAITTGLWRCSATALKPQQSGAQIQPTHPAIENNPDFPPQATELKPPDDKKNNGFGRHDKNAVDSARYAAVAIDKNGNIIRTDVTHISSLTEEKKRPLLPKHLKIPLREQAHTAAFSTG